MADPILSPSALAQLHDIVLPAPVGWWPPSSALIGLLVGAGGIIIGLTWYFLTQRKENQYRREAQDLFKQALANATTPQEKLISANRLLKQVAMTNYGRRTVASLHGDAWVRFLKQTANYIQQPDHLEQTLSSPYQRHHKAETKDIEEALNYAQNWIKGHHK